jgi:hypothetical protein
MVFTLGDVMGAHRESRRRLVMLTVVGAILAFAAEPRAALAGAKMADRTYSFTVTNSSGEEARGFYIAVPGILPKNVDTTKSGGKILTNVRVNPPPGGGTGVTIFFENKNNGIANTKSETITLRLTGLGAADQRFGVSGFRDKGDATGLPIGTAVFNPTSKVIGDPIFSLLNNADTPQNYEIHNLQFLANVSEFPDPTVALDFTKSFGFTPATPSLFTMASTDTESMPFSLPPIDDGNWLYARFQIFNSGVDTGDFVLGQQYLAEVPEPSAIVLAGIGAGVLAIAGRRSASRMRVAGRV